MPRLGSGIAYSVPRGTYRCSDGEWVAISTSAETVAVRVMAVERLTSRVELTQEAYGQAHGQMVALRQDFKVRGAAGS